MSKQYSCISLLQQVVTVYGFWIHKMNSLLNVLKIIKSNREIKLKIKTSKKIKQSAKMKGRKNNMHFQRNK